MPAVLLAAAAVALLVASVLTRQRLDRTGDRPLDAATAWRQRHSHADPAATEQPFVRGYLALTYAAARPLARAGVHPHVLTAWSVWWAVFVVVVAAAGRGGWAVAAGLILVSALADGVDGTVASMTQRTSALGARLDTIADRAADLLFIGALLAAHGHPLAGVAAGAALLVHEEGRRLSPPGAPITVGERPTRIAAAVIGLLGAAALGATRDHAAVVAGGSLVIMATLTVAGSVQLLVWNRRRRRPVTRGR